MTKEEQPGNEDLNSETLFLVPSTFRTRTVPATSCSSAGWHFLHMKTLMLRLTAANEFLCPIGGGLFSWIYVSTAVEGL